ncbi:MAG: FecR domain-containing protein [Butyricimonas paravirosa]
MCEVNLKEYVGWRNGLYVFSHLTLEELMRVIERNYDVTVFFANEECKRLVFREIYRSTRQSSIFEIYRDGQGCSLCGEGAYDYCV